MHSVKPITAVIDACKLQRRVTDCAAFILPLIQSKRELQKELPQEKRDYTGTAIHKRKENNKSSISFRVMSRSEGASRRSQVP